MVNRTIRKQLGKEAPKSRVSSDDPVELRGMYVVKMQTRTTLLHSATPGDRKSKKRTCSVRYQQKVCISHLKNRRPADRLSDIIDAFRTFQLRAKSKQNDRWLKTW